MKLTLKTLRANLNMIQEEAPKAVGVSVYIWYNYKNGRTFPDIFNY